MNYEELLIEADSNNLITKEKPLRGHAGRIKGNRIAIKQDLSTTEKGCVMAEELGHYYTTTGNILDLKNIANAKQERIARLWAYNRMVGLTGIVNAYKARCMNRHEVAEYLGVTEQFLEETLECYRSKYGAYTSIDNYIIGFEPNLYVVEKFE